MSEGSGRTIVTAAEGVGPLLQRDYWATLSDCPHTPEQVVAIMRAGLPYLSPPELARFERLNGARQRLAGPGARIHVDIRMQGQAGVQMMDVEPSSFTMCTLDDHPEAGRITFAAERDAVGRVVVHIRSRARAHGLRSYLGYLLGGILMQTRVWKTFLERLAMVCGAHIVGKV